MSEPLITVCVPVFNGASHIQSCLKAVKLSDFKSFELLVVDDGSTDNTFELAQPFADRIIRHNENLGLPQGRQTGLEACNSKYILYLDSDVLVQSDAIELVYIRFESIPEIDAITGCLSLEHPNSNFASQYKNLYVNFVWHDLSEWVNTLYGGIFALRKETAIPFNVDSQYWGEDQHYSKKIRKLNRKIYFMPELQGVHLHRYTLCSLIRHEFDGCHAIGKLVEDRSDSRFFSGNCQNQHVREIIATPFLALFFGFSIYFELYIFFSIGCVLLWFILNQKLIKFIAFNKSVSFLLVSIPFTVLLQIIKTAAGFAGVCSRFMERKSGATD